MPYYTADEQAGFARSYTKGKEYVVVAGGFDNTRTWLLDLRVNQWIPGPNLPIDIRYAGVIQLEDTFLIVGGNSVSESRPLADIYEFDPELETWEPRPEKLAHPRDHMAAFLVPNSYANCTSAE